MQIALESLCVMSMVQITYFNGNQIGALLLNYRIQQTSQLRHRLMIQSIVSSDLTKSLARYNNVEYKEVLTGFKFIAQEIRQLDDYQNMIFAFERELRFSIRSLLYVIKMPYKLCPHYKIRF